MKKSPRRPRATDTQVTYRPSLWIRVKNALSGQGVSRKNRRKRSKGMTSVWQRVRTAANSSGRGVGAGILGLAPHMGVVIIGLAIPVVVALGYRYLTNTPSLSIREVQVEGNQRVTPPEILEAAGVAHGPNLLALDLDDVETGLIAHPWVRTAKAERALPDRLHIKLSERSPALLLSLGSLYLVDVRGEIFKRVAPTEQFALPILTGIDRTHLTGDVGVEHADRARRTIRDAIALVDLWRGSAMGEAVELREVRADPLFGFGVVLGAGSPVATGTLVHLGHEPNEDQLERLSVLLDTAEARRQLLAEIHLDDERDPNRIAVRFRSESASEKEEVEGGRQGVIWPRGQQGTTADIRAIALTKKERVN